MDIEAREQAKRVIDNDSTSRRGRPTVEEFDAAEFSSDRPTTPPDLLEEMARTYRERNKTYGDNYLEVGKVMDALFPDGLRIEGAGSWNKYLVLFHIINKLTRLTQGGVTHIDSAHDIGVYAAMLESMIRGK